MFSLLGHAIGTAFWLLLISIVPILHGLVAKLLKLNFWVGFVVGFFCPGLGCFVLWFIKNYQEVNQ